ncbi:subtilisin cleaved region like protein [Schizosaccharomyces japonicus yFS275]|uniref:Subtilisin cleaved region like protein n=1 Tax=Schizosaccharomyces japonicus (strain yFS275 / FY16936) TaxID=402676 RepID=B6JXE4_SCHJY|nr:subtilisin cleaved region like protein [Schizosaccharomyces japonicus yFS275]EEB06045.1 subtilisin cleaved region like protein [Schizosaccharomyces japonicus yFS275]
MSSKSYIIQLSNDADDASVERFKKDVEAKGGKIGHTYDTLFKGFSVTLDPNTVTTLSSDPLVASIEEDKKMHTL